MKEMIIQKYVNMITKNDIIDFASKQNIKITNNEADIIFEAIKNNWKTIIYGDYNSILNKYSNYFSTDKLNKMEELIILYKNKFQNFI